mmetsp:Transcript_10493/g.25346  ORF Transcript_10493/g.25346 Transcript_10493/m.25346 type:complete len:127 (+) Transcript_10493:140-520(+)
MPRTVSTVLCFLPMIWMFSSPGLVRGDVPLPRLLRSNAKGESLTLIEGMERDSILKEFRFEKSSSSRLSTREDAWQHEDASPMSRDFRFDDDSDEERDIESRRSTPRETLLRHRTQTSNISPLKES